VILIVLVRALGLLDMTMLTTFTDRFSGQSWPMVPPPETPWHVELALVATMRVSPHQIQILGLYVVLLALAPAALWLLQRRLLGPFFALTWGLYFAGWLMPVDTPLMGMQWEFAFPLPMYQVLFTHALAVGFYRQEIAAWLAQGSCALSWSRWEPSWRLCSSSSRRRRPTRPFRPGRGWNGFRPIGGRRSTTLT
jgi:hypothetical protein